MGAARARRLAQLRPLLTGGDFRQQALTPRASITSRGCRVKVFRSGIDPAYGRLGAADTLHFPANLLLSALISRFRRTSHTVCFCLNVPRQQAIWQQIRLCDVKTQIT